MDTKYQINTELEKINLTIILKGGEEINSREGGLIEARLRYLKYGTITEQDISAFILIYCYINNRIKKKDSAWFPLVENQEKIDRIRDNNSCEWTIKNIIVNDDLEPTLSISVVKLS